MKVIAIVLLLASAAYADDPPYPCKPAPADAKLEVYFNSDVRVVDLAVWVEGFTCKNVVFDAGLATKATKVNVLAPGKMSPKQALELFVDALDAVGLVAVIKTDTIIIKPGPRTPRTCPDLADAAPPHSPMAPRPPTAAPEASNPADVDDQLDKLLDSDVRKIDDNHVEVTHAVLDAILQNPMLVAKAGRVVPAIKDGKPNGFKLYGIRPRSLFARLGLVNGDRIATVNGDELTSVDKALEVYTKLADAHTIELGIERRGQPLTLTITIK
jgi:hypothetical protein